MNQPAKWRVPCGALAVGGLAVAALLGTAVRPAFAQDEPRMTLAGGYSFVREQGPGGFEPATYPTGWMVAGSHRIGSGRLAAIGEFGLNGRDNVVGERQRLVGMFGGAKMGMLRSARMALFAQALVGVERFSEPGFVESGLAIQPGAGVDWALGARYFLRVQGDYRVSWQTGGRFNNVRVAVGGGVRIGS